MCKLIKNLIECNDPAPSPNLEYYVYVTEEEGYDEIPEEVSRLLECEENTIQPYKEPLRQLIWVHRKIQKKSRLGNCFTLI